MKIKYLRNAILVSLVVFVLTATATAQRSRPMSTTAIPNSVLLKIIRYEDQRSWNDDLRALLLDQNAPVRQRATLAAGRIGDERAVPPLADMLLTDRNTDVRQMAAFALGEIESPGGAYALTEVLKRAGSDMVDAAIRARAVEALGKIVAAMVAGATPNAAGAGKTEDDDRLDIIRAAIVDVLRFEDSRRLNPDRLTILLALTAVLRAKPDGVGPLVARFLEYSDPQIVATALNTMARLRLKDGNEQVRKLLNHSDPIVRANAARVIGAAEHKEAFDALLDRALHDQDLRVRVSAIRALGSLKDARVVSPLLARAKLLTIAYRFKRTTGAGRAPELNEILEIATTLGRTLANSNNRGALDWLWTIRTNEYFASPELEIASVRISPGEYLRRTPLDIAALEGKPADISRILKDWHSVSGPAQGLQEIPSSKEETAAKAQAQKVLAEWLKSADMTGGAMPAVTQAYAAFKPADLDEVLRNELNEEDTIVRATAAELLGQQSPSDANTRALADALPRALRDRDLNDAALAILDALAKQKNSQANDAIKTALNSDDHLIRRKAVALLKANGVGDFSDRIGLVKTRYTDADYRRAIARIGRKTIATVVTSKGSFLIEFLTEDAPLTVDNFIQLAKKGFFNGQTIPRVVPNFVIQAGDPRGDQNGGPGYQIRCEINENPYDRASVGMALSGKDTGGSQWFVTHSPQPHLDGGYTVFGRVIRGMDVVDNIVRGDVIRRVIVNER